MAGSRPLDLVDSVLTLASAVVSVPSGTASLTDRGIVPALVGTIALDGCVARMSLVEGTEDIGSPLLRLNLQGGVVRGQPPQVYIGAGHPYSGGFGVAISHHSSF